MENGLKVIMYLSIIFALICLSIDCWAESAEITPEYYPANRLLCPGRYQLVAGEYDVKIKATASNQTKYETHRTMFLIDTYSGRVWLFLAEKDMFQGRWGWIPARGIVRNENTDRKDE